MIDVRGRVLAGLDTMNGLAANRLNGAGGGSCGVSMTTIGANCGQQVVSLVANQIPAIASTNPSQSITVSGAQGHNLYGDGAMSSLSAPGGGTQFPAGGAFEGINGLTFAGNNAISVTSTAGTQGVPTVQPTIAVNVFLRVQ